MKVWMLAFVAATFTLPGLALADHHGEKERLERAGNCNDAKQQMAYFCDDSNAGADSMGTNAKNNVKAACEGIDTPDAEYTFDN
jgi:hypothetical protein